MGTESCGKSTLVRNLAKYFNTTHVEEAGRYICDDAGGIDNMQPYHYFEILFKHKQLEFQFGIEAPIWSAKINNVTYKDFMNYLLIILAVIFFGTGSYYNHGIGGVYYALLTLLGVFMVTGIVMSVISKKEQKAMN